MTAPSDHAGSPACGDVLETHHDLCEEALTLALDEGQALDHADPFPESDFAQRRNALLPRLSRSLESLRRARAAWLALPPAARKPDQRVGVLMQRTQEIIMRIIVLERENEQRRLRRGLVPPRHLPAALRLQPPAVMQRYYQHLPA